MDTKKRIAWIDMARGLAIIFVMLGHLDIPMWFRVYIYSFHLPLFFFVSGYLFKADRSLAETMIHMAKRLLWPLLTLSIIKIVYYVLLWVILPGNTSHLPTILGYLIGLCVQYRDGAYQSMIWFISCLVVTELLLWAAKNLSRKVSWGGILLLEILAAVSYMEFIHTDLPWSLDAALVILPVMTVGKIFEEKESWFATLSFSKYWQCLLGIGLGAALAGINYKIYGKPVDLYYSRFGNWIFYYMSALTGTLSIIALLQKVKESKILCYVGKNSLIFYAFHSLLYSLSRQILGKIGISLGFAETPVLFIMAFGLLSIGSYIVSRWMPKLIKIEG